MRALTEYFPPLMYLRTALNPAPHRVYNWLIKLRNILSEMASTQQTTQIATTERETEPPHISSQITGT